MGHSLLETFKHDALFGELDVESLFGTEVSGKVDQAIASARKLVSDYRPVTNNQSNDIQWIEVAKNTAQESRSDGEWIEVTQNVAQGKRGDIQWIEVTHNITQGKYGEGQWIEVTKKTPVKVRVLQISYLVALTTIGFTLGLSLFS